MKENLMPKTFGETLYGYLKEAILTGEVKSGQRLQERVIAKEYSVSVTPVREAFRRLSAEKLLMINARKEVMVEDVTNLKIKELFEVISPLDLIACKKAVHNLDNNKISSLRDMTLELKSYHDKKMIREYMKLDLIIHETIWKECDNKFLSTYLIELGEKYAFFCNNIIAKAENPSSYLLIDDHLFLLEAIENKNLKAMESILSLHWGKGLIEL
jgi:DNA-binding GntR family transcriptional regulator